MLREVTGAMERYGRKEQAEGEIEFVPCDAYAAAVMIDESLVAEGQRLYVTVELSGKYSKGATVIDWYGRHSEKRNCEVVLKLDIEKYEKMMRTAFCE